MISNLSDHKSKKKNQKIVRDLTAILNVLTLAQKGLSHFKVYVAVQEIVSVLATNVVLLEMQLKKYEQELKRINES